MIDVLEAVTEGASDRFSFEKKVALSSHAQSPKEKTGPATLGAQKAEGKSDAGDAKGKKDSKESKEKKTDEDTGCSLFWGKCKEGESIAHGKQCTVEYSDEHPCSFFLPNWMTDPKLEKITCDCKGNKDDLPGCNWKEEDAYACTQSTMYYVAVYGSMIVFEIIWQSIAFCIYKSTTKGGLVKTQIGITSILGCLCCGCWLFICCPIDVDTFAMVQQAQMQSPQAIGAIGEAPAQPAAAPVAAPGPAMA